jgi:hypothetical protein
MTMTTNHGFTRAFTRAWRSATAALLITALPPLAAQEVKPEPAAPVSVRDFGAKGDGVTDDTAAIRAAVKAAFERRRIPQHPKYGYFVSLSEVYFPNGHFLISDTIDINAVNLRGEAYAAIEQKDPAKDLFTTPWAWRQKIEGMTFLGGRVQLDLGNNNIDSGHVTVRDCHFKGSHGVAVQMRKGSNSSFFQVEKCVFIDCLQAVINYCDMAAVDDTWISSAAAMDSMAVIENHGVMHISNLLGVPRVSGAREDWTDPSGRTRTASRQRWIDNYGVLHVRNSRFGGEDGGFAAVYNFAPFAYKYPVIPSSVTLDSCYLYNAQNTSIVLKEIPNLLTVTNCTGMVDAWVVRVDKSIDLDTYFDREGQKCGVSINIAGNYGGFGPGLPQQLWPYSMNEIVAEAPPAKGNWTRGQFVRNPNVEGHYTAGGWVKVETPAVSEPHGWLCIESGKPGTWQAIPYIGAAETPAEPATKEGE